MESIFSEILRGTQESFHFITSRDIFTKLLKIFRQNGEKVKLEKNEWKKNWKMEIDIFWRFPPRILLKLPSTWEMSWKESDPLESYFFFEIFKRQRGFTLLPHEIFLRNSWNYFVKTVTRQKRWKEKLKDGNQYFRRFYPGYFPSPTNKIHILKIKRDKIVYFNFHG